MSRPLSIAIISAHHSYRFNDFSPLAKEPELRIHRVHSPKDFGQPDIIILPGTEDAAADLDYLDQQQITPLIHQHHAAHGWVVGICGGLHMMSDKILDPHCRKYPFTQKKMLGLLQLDTVYGLAPSKARLRHVRGPWGSLMQGYETHRGQASGEEPVLFHRADGSSVGFGQGRSWATYLHLCFHNAPFRRRFLAAVRHNEEIRTES